MAKRVRLTTEAYLAVGLHASKYSFSPVFGYFLGTEKGGVIDIQKAYPVSHHIPLSPLLEMSAEMAERQHAPLKIVGVYYGSEVNPHPSLDKQPLYIDRIALNIKAVQGECIVLQIQNTKIADNDKCFLEPMGQYKVELIEEVSHANSAITEAITGSKRDRLLNDFEDFINSSGREEMR